MWNCKIPPGLCVVLFILLARMNFWFKREIMRVRKTGSLFRHLKKFKSLRFKQDMQKNGRAWSPFSYG
jgi:hypothetical protein